MRLFPRKLMILNLCLLLLVAGCGSDPAAEEQKAESQVVEKATSVKVSKVKVQDLEEHFTLPATLEAWEDLTLAAELAGQVDWVGPEEGALLVADERIMTIDSFTQKANLDRDRVDAEIKQKNMARLQRLVAENLVSRQEYDNSVTAYEAARQNLRLAKINLRKSRITAPVAGVLDARLIERGEYVAPGDPVAVVVQVDRLKALIDVPEKDARYFHVGEEVQVIQTQIDTGDEVRRDGTMVYLAYKADPMTKTYRAKVEVDNRDGQLRPGMIVRVESLRRAIKNAIAIPLYAVIDLDGRKVVYVEEQGKAALRLIKLDRVIGDQVVIVEGLELNDHLIVRGHQLLVDGSIVKVEAD